jgi:hypothetical protein
MGQVDVHDEGWMKVEENWPAGAEANTRPHSHAPNIDFKTTQDLLRPFAI